MRVINRSLSERGGNAASVHVVQVLVLLAVEDVVVDDLEASEARARRGPPMAYGVFSEFAERYRRGRHAHGLLVLRVVRLPGARLMTRGHPRRRMA